MNEESIFNVKRASINHILSRKNLSTKRNSNPRAIREKITLRVDSELSMKNINQSIPNSSIKKERRKGNWEILKNKLSPKYPRRNRLFSNPRRTAYFGGVIEDVNYDKE
mmetsp:Transcript_20900/g.18533  ORF Transcript_20900/g.18533 Transcript_20900/m.18533 type:complete len:109 (+) Transcript_20900:707-1033(+)